MPKRKVAPAENAGTVDDDERVSLHPLDFEEALDALLRTDPDGSEEDEVNADGDGS